MSSGAVRVLLVCTGNICRSPIAHGLLEDRSGRLPTGLINVRSAGTWAGGGSPATREAVAAAQEVGVDIARHRSSPLSREAADWADLVVTMTAEQAGEVARVAPDAEPKTFTLKELVALLEELPRASGAADREGVLRRVAESHGKRQEAGPGELADADVADPLGLSESVYRAVAQELEGLIDRLVVGLVGG